MTMTTSFSILSSNDLSSITGGANTGYDAPGTSCAPDKRWAFQKVLPMGYGGRAAPACNTEGRVWFNKGALDGGAVGERQLNKSDADDLGNLGGKL
jgi:hypothetical protein